MEKEQMMKNTIGFMALGFALLAVGLSGSSKAQNECEKCWETLALELKADRIPPKIKDSWEGIPTDKIAENIPFDKLNSEQKNRAGKCASFCSADKEG